MPSFSIDALKGRAGIPDPYVALKEELGGVDLFNGFNYSSKNQTKTINLEKLYDFVVF